MNKVVSVEKKPMSARRAAAFAAYGFGYTLDLDDFSICIQSIATNIAEAMQRRERKQPARLRLPFSYSLCYLSVLKGIGAGLAIARHLERERLAQERLKNA